MAEERVIWKYPLELTNRQEIAVPFGARPLSVGQQEGQLMLWALVRPDHPMTGVVVIRIVGTGHLFESESLDPEYCRFIGTVQMPVPGTPGLVWHVFEQG